MTIMTDSQKNWHKYFMKMTDLVASKSKDRSTKVGCVIVDDFNSVVSTGYNGFPRSVNDDIEERHQRPAKYLWTEHAERNAIYSAARNGIPLQGKIMYISGHGLSCADCARAIIQSGIKTVITGAGEFQGKGDWALSMQAAQTMFNESGIDLVFIPDDWLEG